MSELDIAIVAVVLLSALIGVFRGLVKEVLSLLSWAVSLFLAWRFAGIVGEETMGFIGNPTIQVLVAAGLIFVLALVATTIISYLIHKLVSAAGLTTLDRVLGLSFGVLRGGLIVAAVVLLVADTSLSKADWWQKSSLVESFSQAGLFLLDRIPPDIARYIASR